jgi:hypothetical protein
MLIKTLQELTVPEEKNTIFVSPDFSSWPSLLLENTLILQKLPDLLKARRELLNIAEDYTRTITQTSFSKGAIKNIIVTGHQAIWHHCGVLAKNLVTAGFAENIDGCGVHLVLDHDICDTAMVFPQTDNRSIWYLDKIAIECQQNSLPLELRPPPPQEKIEKLINTITHLRPNQFCGNIWVEYLKGKSGRIPPFQNIADFITCFQSMLNFALGFNMMYLPVSQLSESNAFLNFAASIIADSPNFVRSYNNAVSRHIDEKKIHSSETIRLLTADYSENLVELPFWLLSPDGKRMPLYVKIDKPDKIRIGTASADLSELELLCLSDTAEKLKYTLKRFKHRLRPKAVTLTLFTRLFLADWFVHGIGGALYENITDHILEEYYKIRGISFGISTATMTLPLFERHDSPIESIAGLKQYLRNVKHNPERFIGDPSSDKEPVKSLIAYKKRLIQIAKDRKLSPETKKTAFNSILSVNEKLAKYADETIRSFEKRMKSAQNRMQSDQVLNYREYFFGLFPEEVLTYMTRTIISR